MSKNVFRPSCDNNDKFIIQERTQFVRQKKLYT